MNHVFQGSGVAMVTPFKGDSIDWDALERMVQLHLENGTDALIPCGTTGEPSTLSPKEHEEIVKFVVAKAGGRIPVIAGAGSNSTHDAVEKSLRMQDAGADGLLVVTPYYNRATQEGVRLHFETVADAVQIPVILYNVPSRTGVNMTPETVYQLADHPRIVGLKEACGDLGQLIELFSTCRDKLPIYSGNDDQVYALLSLGGFGVISVAANIVPAKMRDLVATHLEGRERDSLAIQEQLLPLLQQLFIEVNPIPVKAAMAMLGMIEDTLRLPLTPLSREHRPALERELDSLGLL